MRGLRASSRSELEIEEFGDVAHDIRQNARTTPHAMAQPRDGRQRGTASCVPRRSAERSKYATACKLFGMSHRNARNETTIDRATILVADWSSASRRTLPWHAATAPRLDVRRPKDNPSGDHGEESHATTR